MNAVGDLLPLLPSGTRLLVGPDSTAVRSIRGVVGTADQVGRSLSQGDDVVVLLTPVDRADARFDVLLRRASAAGTTMLVVDGSLELGPGTTTLADRLGVAVLATPDPWATSVRLHELIGTGMGPAARAALDASRVALDAGPELDDLFTRLDRSLGHPVRFLDASGLALRGAAVDDTARAVLVRRAGTSDVLIAEGVDETLVAIPVGTGIGPRAWVAVGLSVPIAAEQQVVASALQVAAVAVGHRLLLTRLDDERDARYRMAMLDELRAADGVPAPQLVQRTIAAGWRLDAWHVGARVVARQGVDLVAFRQQVDAAVRAEGIDAVVVEQADGWVLWLSEPDEPGREAVADIAGRLRRAQNTLRTTVETNVGVGSLQAGPAGLVRTLGEAGDAARLAASRPESGHFVHVDRLGLAQLLLAWTQTDTFLPASRQLLAPLERGGGALLTTLAAYLDAESSIAETAAVLGVHRNTVSDRIARVERLLGVDLSDPETRLALHLATRARAGDGG